MRKDQTWYLCDPQKNTQCKKTACAYNPKAKHPVCFSTSNAEFARLDFAGQPCKNPDANRLNGEIKKALE